MSKFLITRWEGRILTALWEQDRPATLNFYEEEEDLLGNIYIGQVKQLVKNIQAAFVALPGGLLCYLSLEDNPRILKSDGTYTGKLVQGDEIVVQFAKEAVKTKAPVVTARWNFTGEYAVLTVGKSGIGVSAKITDSVWAAAARVEFAAELSEEYGLILRTNAYTAEWPAIHEEIARLREQYESVKRKAVTRTCFSCLHRTPEPYISEILGLKEDGLEKIMTDDPALFSSMQETLTALSPDRAARLVLYRDDYPMKKLFSLETELERALSRQVWLKSGGYLVIEPTEALTVIDVNTGKAGGRKNQQETFLKINLEAAGEAARQMRLRNLTGMILIDFINLHSEEARDRVYEELVKVCRKDPIKTTVVDRTRLELVEVTRKKIRRPLHEQCQNNFLKKAVKRF